MEKTRYTTSDIGHQRRIAVEIFKIEGDFLASFTIMMLLATYRLVSEEILREIVEMITKGVMSSKVTREVISVVTGKIVDQGSKDLMCLLKK
jgi:hypothetical protein